MDGRNCWIRRNMTPLLALAAFGLVGCRGSSEKLSSADPFLGRDRIPAQNLPIYGKNDKPVDPILKGATTTSTISTNEPFREGPETTPAGLAAIKSTDEIDPLRFERKVNNSNIVPVSAVGPGTEPLLTELRNIGGRLYAPTKLSNGQYEFRAAMPIGTNGALRTYTGQASTQHAAIRDVVEQIRADQRAK